MQATEHAHSKSNIRRRSAQEMAKITLAKDTRMKQEMTKYISRTEAERQIKELEAELNRYVIIKGILLYYKVA